MDNGFKSLLPDIIDKYIFIEFISYFFFSISLFMSINTFVFVFFGLVDLAVKYGISFYIFLELFIYSLPEMIFYSIPMSVLLASILSIGRFFRDNELIAFYNSGRSTLRLFSGIFIFVSLLTLFSIIFNNFIVSKSNNNFSKKMFYAQYKNNIPISKNNIFYQEFEKGLLKRIFYAKNFNGNTMLKPLVQEFDSLGNISNIISADKAEFKNNLWFFYTGTIYNINDKKYSSVVNFSDYSLPFFNELNSIAREIKEPKEMNFFELKNHIEKLKKAGQKTGFIETQLYQKITISFMTFIFFIISVPISISNKNKNSSFAFTTSLLLIFSYYLLMFAFTAMGSLDIFSPIFCAFAPNIIFFLLFLVLIL